MNETKDDSLGFSKHILNSARSSEGTWSIQIYQQIIKILKNYSSDQTKNFLDSILKEFVSENTDNLTRFKISQLFSFIINESVSYSYDFLISKRNDIEVQCKKIENHQFGREIKNIFDRLFINPQKKKIPIYNTYSSTPKFPIKIDISAIHSMTPPNFSNSMK